jgi:[citrate (pro-3S)-lyase] ligase
MTDAYVSQIYPDDNLANAKLERLLKQEGIRKDTNLDYTCGLFDEDDNLIATGSCYKNTLRCLAVSGAHQGEGLLNTIVTHLIQVQAERGNMHLFLYTKCGAAKYFKELGFYEIIRIEGEIVFMENRKNGFADYLAKLEAESPKCANAGAIVMNANPFTLGHLFLVRTAAGQCGTLHLFMVSEDASLFPFAVRKRLIMENTKGIENIVYHESGDYIISSATFPSYFQKDEEAVVRSHASLDIAVFTRIAKALGITKRFVGDEPFSTTTSIYNRIMQAELEKKEIECVVVRRKEEDDKPISASQVRLAIKQDDWETCRKLVPEATYAYLSSAEGRPVVEAIKASEDVVHH